MKVHVQRLLCLGLSLGSLALLLIGCGASAENPAPAGPPVPPIQVGPAEAQTAPLPVRTSGRLASKAEIQLSFKIDGVIQSIQVDEGDRVERGDELARLNLSEINASVVEARSALQQAKRDLERTERLHRDSVATLEALQNARTGVEIAEARLQTARFNREYAVITAPESGRILRRAAEEGEVVSPGRPVLTLGAVSRGWVVRVGIPARDVMQVQRGDSARVRFDAYPDRTFDARVTEIADAADPRTATFEVELSVDDPEALLKSGFIGRVALYPSGQQRHVVIPATALVEGDGQQGTVFTFDAQSKRVRRTPVRVARVLDSTIAVSEGLQPGTVLVTEGAAALADGDSVRVVESP